MGTVELLLELPDEVAAGLLDGTMKRKGGVIYNSTGGVVMWLKETGSAIESQTTGTPLPLELSAHTCSRSRPWRVRPTGPIGGPGGRPWRSWWRFQYHSQPSRDMHSDWSSQ